MEVSKLSLKSRIYAEQRKKKHGSAATMPKTSGEMMMIKINVKENTICISSRTPLTISKSLQADKLWKTIKTVGVFKVGKGRQKSDIRGNQIRVDVYKRQV